MNRLALFRAAFLLPAALYGLELNLGACAGIVAVVISRYPPDLQSLRAAAQRSDFGALGLQVGK